MHRSGVVVLVLALSGCTFLPVTGGDDGGQAPPLTRLVWEAFDGDATDREEVLSFTPVDEAEWLPFDGDEGRTWKSLPPPPQARFAATSAAFGGMVYVFGGHDGHRPLDTVLRLDPVAGTWSETAARLPSARIQAAAVPDDEQYIYLFGGRTQLSGHGGYLDEVLRYDVRADRVEVMDAVLPHATTALAGAMLGDAVYLTGDGRCIDCRVIKYDPARDVISRTDAVAPSMSYPAATDDGTYLYWFGGAWLEERVALAGIYRYDPARDVVERLDHDLPLAIYAATALHDGDHVWIFGGRSEVAGGDAAVRSAVISFEPESRRVAVAPTSLPDPSSAMTGAWTAQGGVLVAGDELGQRGARGAGTYCFRC